MATAVVMLALVPRPPRRSTFVQNSARRTPSAARRFGVVVATDFNADGRPDAAVVSGTSSTLSVYLRQPGGGFVTGVGLAVPRLSATTTRRRPTSTPTTLRTSRSRAIPETSSRSCCATPRRLRCRRARRSSHRAGAIAWPTSTRTAGRTSRWRLRQRAGSRSCCASRTGFLIEDVAIPTGATAPVRRRPTSTPTADRLAVANLGSDNVTVLLRDPDGGFDARGRRRSPVGDCLTASCAGDVNQDGRPDFAIADHGSDTVTLYRRNAASNGLRRAGDDPVADGPTGLARADFDSDGVPDLAVASASASAVTILAAAAAPEAPISLPGGLPARRRRLQRRRAARSGGQPPSAPGQLAILLNTTDDAQPPPPPPPPHASPTPTRRCRSRSRAGPST